MTILAVIGVAVLLGAAVQGLIGLGLGLVAAPVVTMLAPELMPGMLLWAALFLPLVHLSTQRRDIDWRGLMWLLPARIPGIAVGAWMVAIFSVRELGVTVGIMVLTAVVLTWRAVQVEVSPLSLSVAGALSGVAGTATSIGGPPVALVYQRRPPEQIRNTLAVYFLIGCLMSLGGLAVAGDLDAAQFWFGLAVTPVLWVGLLLGRAFGRRVEVARIRPVILLVCGSSAAFLLIRSLLG